MNRLAPHAPALGSAALVIAVLIHGALAQSTPPGPAQPATAAAASGQAAPTQAPARAAPEQAARAQSTPAPNPRAPMPRPATPPAPVSNADVPQVGGYNNSGGLIDSTALQTEATQGVHYHYHYYGAGAVVSNPGYGQAGYVNPATAPVPQNPYLTPIYGPGNPAPMNTLLGANNDNYNTRVGGAGGAIAAGQVGGQAWSYGGGIGHWNPYAYGGNGYVEGFND